MQSSRTRLFLISAFCLLPFAFVLGQQSTRDAPAQPTRGNAAITGTVFTAGRTPQPVRRARVTLNGVTRGVLGRTTTTDDGGRFEFHDLPAGRFEVQATKRGYLTANYGARRPDRPGTPVTLADGQRLDLPMTMAHGGAITGVIVDASGQPLQGASVSILRYGYSVVSGERMVGRMNLGETTDDRGVYRAWGLPPGEYVVMVEIPVAGAGGRGAPGLEDARRLSAADVDRAQALARGRGAVAGAVDPAVELARLPAGESVNYAPVFYPGTAELASAGTITLGLGEERTGVDLGVRRVPTSRIEGTVRLIEGVAPQTVTIALAPGGPQALLLASVGLRSVSTRLRPDGTFSFVGVTPGQYSVTARPIAGAVQALPVNSPGRTFWGLADVAVEGRDVSVSLDLQPGMTIAARLAFDGPTRPPQNLSAAEFYLVSNASDGNLSNSPAGGQVDAEGRFAFTGVMPGKYRLIWRAQPGAFDGWVIRSAIANGRNVLDLGFDVRPGESANLTVTYTDRPTELAGVLQDASGRPATDYFIVIFPVDRSFWVPASPRVRAVRPGTDGRYVTSGLAPGEYMLAALTDVETGEWNDPKFLEQLAPAGIRVALGEGERRVQDIRIR